MELLLLMGNGARREFSAPRTDMSDFGGCDTLDSLVWTGAALRHCETRHCQMDWRAICIEEEKDNST